MRNRDGSFECQPTVYNVYSGRVVYCQQHNSQDTSSSSSRNKISDNERVLVNLASGALAGALAKTTIAPVDRTKIYFQTTPSTQFSFRNVYMYVSDSYKTSGFTSLWRGNSATMARIIPYAAIQFASHEYYKRILQVDSPGSFEITRFLCGSLAGVTAQTLSYPLDLTRARLAVSLRYSGLIDVFVKTIRHEGVSGLFKGYVPTVLGVIPYAGCSFYCYESLKRLWRQNVGEVGGLQRLMFGAVAGVIGQSSSYPFDIVRRRMQTTEERVTFGVFRMMRDIAASEGVVGGLYKGLSMNWIKGPIAAGISFATFDWVNAVLTEYLEH